MGQAPTCCGYCTPSVDELAMGLEERSFEKMVEINWSQQGTGPGFPSRAQSETSAIQGVWRKKDSINTLLFSLDSASPQSLAANQKLLIEPDAVTMDWTGHVRWSHRFTANQTQGSLMHIGGLVSPVVIEVKAIHIHIETVEGYIALSFNLQDGEQVHPIAIYVHFTFL